MNTYRFISRRQAEIYHAEATRLNWTCSNLWWADTTIVDTTRTIPGSWAITTNCSYPKLNGAQSL